MTDISSADSLIRSIIEKQVKISELENEAKIAKENYSKTVDEWLEKLAQRRYWRNFRYSHAYYRRLFD